MARFPLLLLNHCVICPHWPIHCFVVVRRSELDLFALTLGAVVTVAQGCLNWVVPTGGANCYM